jgi:UDP-glucose 4-epimerase
MNHELVKNEEKGKTSYDLKLHLSEDEFNFFAGIMTKLRPSDIYQVCGIPQKEYSLPSGNGVSPELELDNINKSSNVKFLKADISDYSVSFDEYFEDVDYVFHFAAMADIVPSINNPLLYHKANVDGTINILEAAKKSKNLKKFVYAASSSCYGIPDTYPTLETSSIKPEYPYAHTKRIGEEYVLHWGQVYKLPVVSMRFFNVYGPRHRTSGTYGAVFGVFLAQLLNNKPLTIVGDGEQTRDYSKCKI